MSLAKRDGMPVSLSAGRSCRWALSLKLMLSSLFARLGGLFAPTPDPGRVAFLGAQPFAHRGLHGNGVVENSRPAFDAAIRTGHGMACDVTMSSDGVPFVFHDDTLDTPTAESGPVRSSSADKLDRFMFTGTVEHDHLITTAMVKYARLA